MKSLKNTTNIGISGHYKFYKNGSLFAESDNMIHDSFLTNIANHAANTGVTSTRGQNAYCYLGSDATPPTTNGTGVLAFVKRCTTYERSVKAKDYTSLDDFAMLVHSWSFSFSSFTGTIREAGVRTQSYAAPTTEASTNGAVTDSRVLIRDGNGSPIDLVVTASDIILVTFTLKFLLPTGVASKQFTIGSSDHQVSCVKRCYDSSINHHGWEIFPEVGKFFGEASTQGSYSSSGSLPTNLMSGLNIGTSTAGGSGVMSARSGASCTMTYTWRGIIASAFTSGIKRIAHGQTNTQIIEFEINPPLDASHLGDIAIAVRYNWIRMESGNNVLTPVAVVNNATITEAAPNGAYTTATAWASLQNGLAPLSFAWAWVSGDAKLACNDTTIASPNWSYTGTTESANEVWRCTITDAYNNTYTVDVTIDITWT